MPRSVDFQVRSVSCGMEIRHVKVMKYANPTNRSGIVRTAQTPKNIISLRYLGIGGWPGN